MFLLAVGMGLLFGLRGWRTWGEVARLAGLAYLVGVAAEGIALVTELVVRVPFSLATIVLTGAALGGAGVLYGHRRGHRVPAFGRAFRPPTLGLVTAVAAGLAIVYLEALFRSGRLAALLEFDPWAFWVPKAKAIYYFGGFDPGFFRELSNSSYPPLLPTLEATAFRFMGSPDVVTLHLQFWSLSTGFAAAVVGLIHGQGVAGTSLGAALVHVRHPSCRGSRASTPG